MSGIVGNGFMGRFKGVDPCAYVPGLYTQAEVDDLINIDGYIPVASAEEFYALFTNTTQPMGGCTIWAGNYATNSAKKYIQVKEIDLVDLPQGTTTNIFSGIYNGNEINILNFSSARHGMVRAMSGIMKNVRLYGNIINSDSQSGCGLLCDQNSGTIANCKTNGNVHSISSFPGIAGFCGLNTGAITNSDHTGNVSGVTATIGCFVGNSNSGLIELCNAIGDVTQNLSGGNVFLGGFIGNNSAGSIIKECSYIGNVSNTNADTTRRQMGGFVGSNRASSQIVNCYARGTINGGSFVGGFCGNAVTGATIQNSYCSVAVTFSGATIGGFQSTGGGVTDCYYDSDVSLVSGGNGDPKTTVELQTPTSNTGIYSNWSAIAWDFGTDAEYPELTGLAAPLPDNSIIEGVMIVELGQSNMEGRFGESPLHTSVVGTAYFWDGAAAVHLLNDRGGATGGSHATYFANRLHFLTGKRPIMAECAGSGSGIGADSGAGTNNYSFTGTRRAVAEGQIAAIISAIPNITAPTCALWCQGERDAQQMDSEPTYTVANVKAAMQDVIDWWQTTYPSVPFLISQTGRFNSSDTQGFEDIRLIQQEIVDENTGVYMAFTGAVDFPSTGKMGDNLHYNALGLKDMGEAFADELATLI